MINHFPWLPDLGWRTADISMAHWYISKDTRLSKGQIVESCPTAFKLCQKNDDGANGQILKYP